MKQLKTAMCDPFVSGAYCAEGWIAQPPDHYALLEGDKPVAHVVANVRCRVRVTSGLGQSQKLADRLPVLVQRPPSRRLGPRHFGARRDQQLDALAVQADTGGDDAGLRYGCHDDHLLWCRAMRHNSMYSNAYANAWQV